MPEEMVSPPRLRLLASYLSTSAGRATSERTRLRLALAMERTEVGRLVQTVRQVHLLRRLLDKLDKLRPTPGLAKASSGKTHARQIATR